MRLQRILSRVLLVLMAGCGREAEPPPVQAPVVSVPDSLVDSADLPDRGRVPAVDSPADTMFAFPATAAGSETERNDNDSLPLDFDLPAVRPEPDAERLLAHGIRKIEGSYLTLYTDLPAQHSIEELPHVFDLAVPQWCDYFQVDESRVADWLSNAYLIGDRAKFQAAGLLYDDLPPFLHGFARDAEIWIYEQPSDYYRRHLLLHEGTHRFQQWVFGGAGPPWYMEGMAELLATHSWRDGQLDLRQFPVDRVETEYWGRIKVIREAVSEQRGKSILDILQYGPHAHRDVAPYAWCWALTTFLDSHAATQSAFRQLANQGNTPVASFNETLLEDLTPRFPFLRHEWHHFINSLDYGFDLEREQIQTLPVARLGAEPKTFVVEAGRGWQSTGCELEAGVAYAIHAEGRFQLSQEPRVWWSEANGVTIRYHNGLPLGILLGAIVDEGQPPVGNSPLASPDPLGIGGESAVERSGTLFLRINDRPSELADNAGDLRVTVRRVAKAVPN